MMMMILMMMVVVVMVVEDGNDDVIDGDGDGGSGYDADGVNSKICGHVIILCCFNFTSFPFLNILICFRLHSPFSQLKHKVGGLVTSKRSAGSQGYQGLCFPCGTQQSL